jgi:hypothetical protein
VTVSVPTVSVPSVPSVPAVPRRLPPSPPSSERRTQAQAFPPPGRRSPSSVCPFRDRAKSTRPCSWQNQPPSGHKCRMGTTKWRVGSLRIGFMAINSVRLWFRQPGRRLPSSPNVDNQLEDGSRFRVFPPAALSIPASTLVAECLSANRSRHRGHVWTAAALQEESGVRHAVWCKSCVRPVRAALDRWP